MERLDSQIAREAGHNVVLGATGLNAAQWPALELVSLTAGQQLVEPGARARHAFFPLGCVISVVASTARGESVEVAGIGAEGVAASFAIARDVLSSFQLVVQVPGRAWRIEYAFLDELLQAEPSVRTRMMRFADALISQLALSAVCCRYHTTEQRIARCLLTMTDRWGTPTIPMTHEWMATLIGAGRPRVTGALSRLGERSVIHHSRGEIKVLDREALLALTCECYASVAAYYSPAI